MDPNRFNLSSDAPLQPDFFPHLRSDHAGYIEIDNEAYQHGRRGRGSFISRGTVAGQLYAGHCYICGENNPAGPGNHRFCEQGDQAVVDQDLVFTSSASAP